MAQPAHCGTLASTFAETLHATNESRKSLSDADRRRAEAKRAKPQLRLAAELLHKARASSCDASMLTQMVVAWLRAMLDLTFIVEENLAEHNFANADAVDSALKALDEGHAWVLRLVEVAEGGAVDGGTAAVAQANTNATDATPATEIAKALGAKLAVLHVVDSAPATLTASAPGGSRDTRAGAAAAAAVVHSMAATKTIGTELWETLCWRRGALRYMVAASAIQQAASAVEVPASAQLLEEGVAAFDAMELARGPIGGDRDEFLESPSVEGGTEVAAMLASGMYSDMHLLACMYAGELCYWRWRQLRGIIEEGTSEVSAEQWRSRAELRCRRYVHVVDVVMGGRGWETTRARALLTELQEAGRPPPLRAIDGQINGDGDGAAATAEAAFTLKTVSDRMPKIVLDVVERNADRLDEVTVGELHALAQEMSTGATVKHLAPDGCGHATSAAVAASWNLYLPEGGTWFSLPWFLVENFMYKRILELTRPLLTDPFAAQKAQALSTAADAFASNVLPMVEHGSRNDIAGYVFRSLWGNRADLSLTAGQVTQPTMFPGEAAAGAAQISELLVDDRGTLQMHIDGFGAESKVLVVLDNCGLELLCDLTLADALLRFTSTTAVTLHAKDEPVFVSDVTVPDLELTLVWIADHGGADLADRLRGYLKDGRLSVEAHPFYTSPLAYWQLPPDLVTAYQSHELVFLKGDANYRRLLGDLHWPFDAPFDQIVGYFPAPVCALRTLKSGVCCGVPRALQDQAREQSASWCTSGKFGVVQFCRGCQ